MSKKKNTLKDLDEFLKQQAATLVSPPSLREKIEVTAPPAPTPAIKEQPKAEVPAPEAPSQTSASAPKEVSSASILEDLKALSEKEGVFFRQKLYDLIIQTLESQKKSLPEDKMLINTALYLKSGNIWKEAIREYWKKQ